MAEEERPAAGPKKELADKIIEKLLERLTIFNGDEKAWKDSSFKFKSKMALMHTGAEEWMLVAEGYTDTVVLAGALPEAVKFSQQLYAILTEVTLARAFTLVKKAKNQNGLEARCDGAFLSRMTLTCDVTESLQSE